MRGWITIASQITNAPEIELVKPLQAWTYNGLLRISGLTPEETLSIYTIAGVLVYHSIATSEEMDISLTTQGMYVILNDDRTLRVVFD